MSLIYEMFLALINTVLLAVFSFALIRISMALSDIASAMRSARYDNSDSRRGSGG